MRAPNPSSNPVPAPRMAESWSKLGATWCLKARSCRYCTAARNLGSSSWAFLPSWE